MDLRRRAGQFLAEHAQPVAEKARLPDLTKVRIVSSYGVSIPVVKGTQRVPGVVIRVSSTHALYALCEGPVTAIRKMYRADSGQAITSMPGWVPYLGASDQVFPGESYGMYSEFSELRGIACIVGPLENGRPVDASFEVSTESSANAFSRSPGVPSPEGASPANWTASEMAANYYPDPMFGPLARGNRITAMDVATHTQGDTQVVDVIYHDLSASAVLWTRRGTSGTWSTPVAIHGAYAPLSGAEVQPRILSSASAIHVAWSRKGQDATDVEVVHATSTDAGGSWSYSTVTRPTRTLALLGRGVRHLSLAEAAGTVWIAFHQIRTVPGQTVVGASCGFTIAAKVGGAAWVYPATLTGDGLGYSRELGVAVKSGWQFTTDVRSIAPSIIAVDASHARIAFCWHPYNGPISYLHASVRIESGAIRWDHDAGLHAAFTTTGNALDQTWVEANLSPIHTSVSEGSDFIEFGATRIVSTGASSYALAWCDPLNPETAWRAGFFQRGLGWRWRISAWSGTAWGTAWTPPAERITIPADTTLTEERRWCAIHPHWITLRWDGTLLHVGHGRAVPVPRDTDPAVAVLAVDQVIVYSGAALASMSERMRYYPETARGNDVITGSVVLSASQIVAMDASNLDGDTAWEQSIALVSPTAQTDDALPGDICRMLLTHRTMGARLDASIIDTDSWGRFESYCRATGIFASLVQVQQAAAWPLVCEIIESCNAIPFVSAGKVKIAVRETATVTNGVDSYIPPPEHAGPVMEIDPAHLRGPVRLKRRATTDRRNILPVTYRDRTRNYNDVPFEAQDPAGVGQFGQARAQAQAWPWITSAAVAGRLAWLRLLREVRDLVTYDFEVDGRYRLLEPGDIVTLSDPDNRIAARPVRIMRVQESGSWIRMEAESVRVSTVPEGALPAPDPEPFPTTVAPSVNAPIVFGAASTLTGGTPEVWALLSWPDGVPGCRVQASLDNGATWTDLGTCYTKSSTGWLMATAGNLVVRPDLAPHPGLRAGLFDRIEAADLSESGGTFPAPAGTQFADALPGALIWLDGELIAYRRLTSDLPDQLVHGRHGTTAEPHDLPARVGAVTSAAFRWVPPPGSAGIQARLRFPSLGSSQYLPQPETDASQVTITIPSGA